MATRAELKARLTLDKSVFDRGIAGAQAGATALASGLTSATRIGLRAMTTLGIAAIGLGTAIAIGTKKAFDFGGGMADMSAITGRSVKEILLLRRALQDAGISMEKIDQYILTGRDRGDVIGRALKNMTSKDWADAAASVGKQADILDRNAHVFDRVSDLLGRSSDKLQGFFVGVADRVSPTLLPILEKLDKTDLAGMGQKFGDGLVYGFKAFIGLMNNPQLMFSTFESYFRVAVLGIGNVLIAVFKSAIEFFQTGMASAMTAIGSVIIATLIEAFQKPIAYLQAGIEHALEFNTEGRNIQRRITGLKGLVANAEEDAAITKPGSGAKDKLFGSSLEDAKSYEETMKAIAEWKKQIKENEEALQKADKAGLQTVAERAERIQKEGVRFGFDNGGAGLTSAEWRNRASEQTGESLNAASQTARNFAVPDVLGVGPAMAAAKNNTAAAAFAGNRILPEMPAAPYTAQKPWNQNGFPEFGTKIFPDFIDSGGEPALQSSGLSTVSGMSRAYKTGGYNETYTNEEARIKAEGKDKAVELGKPGVLDAIEANTKDIGANR